MRLATFNILHGRSLADGVVSVERLAAACRSLEVDVLCLQEVDRGQDRSGGADQTAEVAAALGSASWRFEPAIVGVPGGLWRPAADEDTAGTGPGGEETAGTGPGSGAGPGADEPRPSGEGQRRSGTGGGAAYGVAIVSRLPVERWHVLRLAAAPVRSPVMVPGGRGRFLLLRDEPRVVLAAEVDAMVVATTHLSFVPGYNLVQLRRAVRWLEGLGPSAVLAGDLNAPGPLPRWTSGWRSLAEARTYPADRPRLQVDHVLGRGDLPPVTAVEVRRLALSDHRALVVALVPS
ncbi:MAG: endonuclease/exonuclease/phosphatase family protein [Actinomycetota bacterium]